MRPRIQEQNQCGLFKFFRSRIQSLEESEIIELDKTLENEIKQIKYDAYKIGWYMRGSFSYNDLMYTITNDDREILNRIIKENIDVVKDTKMPLL